MDAIKADRALRACLQAIEASPRPAVEVGKFFEELAGDPNWSGKELGELQLLVIKTIVERWRGPDAR